MFEALIHRLPAIGDVFTGYRGCFLPAIGDAQNRLSGMLCTLYPCRSKAFENVNTRARFNQSFINVLTQKLLSHDSASRQYAVLPISPPTFGGGKPRYALDNPETTKNRPPKGGDRPRQTALCSSNLESLKRSKRRFCKERRRSDPPPRGLSLPAHKRRTPCNERPCEPTDRCPQTLQRARVTRANGHTLRATRS